MIRIILKTLWFNKSKNGILFIEFVAISIIFILAFNYIFSQLKLINQPLGYNYNNIITVSMLKNNRDTVIPGEKAFFEKLKHLNGVENVSRADRQSQPFSGSWSSSTALVDSTAPEVALSQYGVDENYAALLEMNLLYGRWFQLNDTVGIYHPVIITSTAAKELFGMENALNRKFQYRGDTCVVIGVTNLFKTYTFDKPEKGIFMPDYIAGENSQCSSVFTYMVKYRTNPELSAIDELYTTFNVSKVSENHRLLELKTLEAAKSSIDLEDRIKFYGVITIVIFLLLNVMAGMAGLLWQTIKQRNYEFALRMALGATKLQIRNQVVLEMITLVVLSLIPTFIFLSQFEVEDIYWAKDEISLFAVILSTVILIVLTIVFTYFPSYRASRTQPAAALKGE